MSRWSIIRLIVLCFVAAVHGAKDPLKEAVQFCEYYVQCNAVTTLEERLCLGNSYERPHWLPDIDVDVHNCHQKLRNDYILLERMEEKLDDLLTACLINNTVPFTADKLHQCNERVLRTAAIFSFGHSIHYIPTNCFNGLNIRRRQCDDVRACCPALLRCSTIPTQSDLARSIEKVRMNMINRAKQCENGSEIEKLQLPPVCLDDNQIESQVLQHSTEHVTQSAVVKEEEPKNDDGENVDLSSGEGSGYDIFPSGYKTSQISTDEKDTTLTSAVDTTGSGYRTTQIPTDNIKTIPALIESTESSHRSDTVTGSGQLPTNDMESNLASTVDTTGSGYKINQIPNEDRETTLTPIIDTTGSAYRAGTATGGDQIPTDGMETNLAATVDTTGSGYRIDQIPNDDRETTLTPIIDTTGSGYGAATATGSDQMPTDGMESNLASTVDTTGSGYKIDQIPNEDRETTLTPTIDTTGSAYRAGTATGSDQMPTDGMETNIAVTVDTTGSGYRIDQIPTDDSERIQSSFLQVDTTGSGYDDGSGAIAEGSGSLQDANYESVQKGFESTTSPLLLWL